MKGLKKYILTMLILFVIFFLTGYSLAELNEQWARESIQKLMEELRPLVSDNLFIQFLNIFFHNAVIALIIILTFFSLGVIALISLFSNGIILGAVFNIFQKEIGTLTVLSLILPHGIVELPTFILTVAIGIRLAVQFAKSFSPKHSFKGCFPEAMKLYLKVIVPLLLLAALIESFITPFVAEMIK